MIDALQAREISKTNFQALENDLENNNFFKMVSNIIDETARNSKTSVNIPYSTANERFTDVLTVLKWKGFKIKHYQCMNTSSLYYEGPKMAELQYEPSYETIKQQFPSSLDGYFTVEW